jgi:hypothetical protein
MNGAQPGNVGKDASHAPPGNLAARMTNKCRRGAPRGNHFALSGLITAFASSGYGTGDGATSTPSAGRKERNAMPERFAAGVYEPPLKLMGEALETAWANF